ncbi:hypothetical protein N7528_007359 [Penicillium herquei]|nr:hypothetical protein N7528_007359 [Penicillium herquei]
MNPTHQALLQREHFDWCEDVEESLDMDQDKGVKQYNADHGSDNGNLTGNYHNMHGNGKGLVSTDVFDFGTNNPAESSEDNVTESSEESIFESRNDDSDTVESVDPYDFDEYDAGIERPELDMSDDGVSPITTSHYTWSENRACLSCIDRAIDAEFAWRQFCMEQDPNIHHYNLFGQAVYEPSGTSAPESLAIILSPKTKSPVCSENYLATSIMNRARVFLDPVSVDVTQSNLHLRGSELMDSVQGRVNKCYSPHGKWQQQTDKVNIVTAPDDPASYFLPGTAIAAGFLDTAQIVEQRRLNGEDEIRSLPEPTGLPRKLSWQAVPSRLNSCHLQAHVDALDTPSTAPDIPSNEAQILISENGHTLELPQAMPPANMPRLRRKAKRYILSDQSQEISELDLTFFPPFPGRDIKISKREQFKQKIKTCIEFFRKGVKLRQRVV